MAQHRTLPVPPPPDSPPPRRPPPGPHAPLLLAALGHAVLDDPPERTALVGFTFVEGGVDLVVTAAPPDPRCDAAGLFGFTAPAHWCGAGVVCTGRARLLLDAVDDGPAPVEDVLAAVVVGRDGSVASHLRAPGGHLSRPDEGPSGLLVDTLHRVLGRSSPGTAPPVEALVVGLWVDELVELAVAGHPPSWADAVACGPGAPGRGRVPASPETVAASAAAAVADRTWGSLRGDAAAGTFAASALLPEEAAWMDDPMFARWVLSGLPDLRPALALLRSVGAEAAAVGVEEVARLVAPGI